MLAWTMIGRRAGGMAGRLPHDAGTAALRRVCTTPATR
jgi:hypothetical protein